VPNRWAQSVPISVDALPLVMAPSMMKAGTGHTDAEI